MAFYADLHVHSRYSRATSRDCDLENLSFWAQRKGIDVVGTGDFTHPAWIAELREKLVPAEPGLFRLRPELERLVAERLGPLARTPTRFLLSVEISSIYKRDERTRKVHNLVYAPDLDRAAGIVERLGRIGNLRSDGRPILGLDARDLLEIVLEAGEGCYLVPAHAWTPWFSVLGSRSGFDAVDDCFADLAPHVFAIETGLSSDPAMNWRLSQLDRFRLVSSSDAHSPQKLGREATVFETELDYFAMKRALETGLQFGGTVEFFPEEGKYHLDGHRSCEVRLSPEESRAAGGVCPACGKSLTLGVLNRVEALADRPDGFRPEGAASFRCLVPLPEVLAEITRTSPTSQRVLGIYEALLAAFGPELHILERSPLEVLERSGRELLAEAIARMRAGRVHREAGYDGEYGVIRMFTEGELGRSSSLALFGAEQIAVRPATPRPRRARAEVPRSAPGAPPPAAVDGHEAPPAAQGPPASPDVPPAPSVLDGLDPDQRRAAETCGGPLLIVAGPGTGKTRTLTHRIAHLVLERGVPAERCLAITFTRRAAEELRERLAQLLRGAGEVAVRTFHGLGLEILRAHGRALDPPLDPDFEVASDWERGALLAAGLDLGDRETARWLEAIARAKQSGERPAPGSELEQAMACYQRNLRARGLVDQDDLLVLPVTLLEARPEVAAACRARWPWLSIDEYQDIDALQYRLVRALTDPAGDVCAIGDPDQAIYAFRGGDVRFFGRFREDYPGARLVELGRSYRSTRTILDAALAMIAPGSLVPGRALEAVSRAGASIAQLSAPTEAAEAEHIVHRIEALLGGYSFYSVDSGRVAAGDAGEFVFSDIAILYRTAAQLEPLEKALERSGIPYQRRSHERLLDRPGVRAVLAALTPSARVAPLEAALAEAVAAADGADPADLEMVEAVGARAQGDWSRFFAEISAATEVDTWDPRADRVALLTLHASKGLEFPVVFIAGCEDGIIPHRLSGQATATGRDGDVAEERRLLFVGMTRARQRLFLSAARSRLLRGALLERSPSPFLAAIPADALAAEPERAAIRRPRSRQLALF